MDELFASKRCSTLDEVLYEGARGCVHSVFSSALNLRVGNKLVTLLAGGRSLLPRSFGLSGPAEFSAWGLCQGDAVVIGSGALLFPTIGRCVDFGNAQGVSLLLFSPPDALMPGDWEHRLACAASALATDGRAGEGLAPLLGVLWPACPCPMEHNPFTRQLLPAALRLHARLPLGTPGELTAIAGDFAGCGPGLTPSSDDFLCGAMAALHSLSGARSLPAAAARANAAALARGALPRTNEISASFLSDAAEGLFSEDMLALVKSFFAPAGGEDIVRYAARVAAHGSTSGCDILTGFCFCVHAAQSAAPFHHPTEETK